MNRSRDAGRDVALLAAVAVVQIGGTALAARQQEEYGSLPMWAAVVLAVPIVALLQRRRVPVATAWLVLAATWTYSALDTPRGPVFIALIVAFGNLIVAGRRAHAIAVAATGLVAFSWLEPLVRGDELPPWWAVAALAGWLATLFSVAELVRVRRGQRRAAEQTRAATLQRQIVAERLRIARDLHDVVAHHMSVVNLRAGVALHLAADSPPEIRGALDTIKSSSKQALTELRSILDVLRDVDAPALEDRRDTEPSSEPRLPTPSIADLAQLVATTNGTPADVSWSIDLDDLDTTRVPATVQVAVYRIVQESLTNVLRHAQPMTAEVRVVHDGDAIVIDVTNPTPPTTPVRADETVGNGLAGMRERAQSVGGCLTAGPGLAGRFAVHARIPTGPST